MNNKQIQPSASLLSQILLDPARDLPLHAQLRRALEQLINKHFSDGSTFFSEADLIGHLGVSQGTIRRALADLATQGLLERKPARCSIVHRVDTHALKNLAVFLQDYALAPNSQLLNAISIECIKRGIQLQAFYTHKGELLGKAYELLKFPPQTSGAILLGNSPSATLELHGAMEEKRIRCVCVNTFLKEMPMAYVGVDNKVGIELGLDYLRKLGHRKVVLLVNEPEEVENIVQRMEVFEAYCKRYPEMAGSQIHHCRLHWGGDGIEAAMAAMNDIWAFHPTAIFSVSATGALVALRWLGQREVKVPKEVSVLAFDDASLNNLIHPSLTSLTRQYSPTAQAAVDYLANPTEKPCAFFIPPRLVKRESTGRAPVARARR